MDKDVVYSRATVKFKLARIPVTVKLKSRMTVMKKTWDFAAFFFFVPLLVSDV